MTREAVRLLWQTITSWRRKPTPDDRPGSDEQWGCFPHLLDRFNDSDQADEDERRYKP